MDSPVVVNLTEDDIVAAYKLYLWSYMRDPKALRRLTLLWIGAQAIPLIVYVLSGMDSNGFLEFLAYLEAVIAIAIFIFPLLMAFLSGPRTARRHFREMKILQGPIKYAWSPDGLRETTQTSTSLIPWNHIPKWREDDKTFIVFASSALYRCMPKHFMTQMQIDDLRANLKLNVAK
jgi:YcxB-like protein